MKRLESQLSQTEAEAHAAEAARAELGGKLQQLEQEFEETKAASEQRVLVRRVLPLMTT